MKNEERKRENLARELAIWLNKNNFDTVTNTPDFILARYVLACLDAFRDAVNDRDEWRGSSAKE